MQSFLFTMPVQYSKAIRKFRKFTYPPLTLLGSCYAAAVQALNKAIDRAEGAR